jgi:hypothetical protein
LKVGNGHAIMGVPRPTWIARSQKPGNDECKNQSSIRLVMACPAGMTFLILVIARLDRAIHAAMRELWTMAVN